jgi:hypothetical protein
LFCRSFFRPSCMSAGLTCLPTYLRTAFLPFVSQQWDHTIKATVDSLITVPSSFLLPSFPSFLHFFLSLSSFTAFLHCLPALPYLHCLPSYFSLPSLFRILLFLPFFFFLSFPSFPSFLFFTFLFVFPYRSS